MISDNKKDTVKQIISFLSYGWKCDKAFFDIND